MSTSTPHRPLAGLTVLDLSQGLAGPSCAYYLCEFGARVIKIEPPEGDWSRPLGGKIDGSSGIFFAFNRGKESLCLDLKQEAARAVVRDLARRSDVFMQSARPGAMERLGLGYEDLVRLKPNIVYLSVSGFGTTGPARELPLTDTAAQAFAGLMSINEGRDGVPHRLGTTIVDNVTGLYAFQGVVMELWGRTSASPPVHLDVSLMQGAAAVQSHNIAEFSLLGRKPQALNPPAGTFPTRDGWIAVTLVHEEHWKRICAAIGLPGIADDPRYRTFAERRINIASLQALLDERLRQETTATWMERLAAADVLASPVNDYGALMATPQMVATGGIPPVTVASGQTVRIPRTPSRPVNTAAAPRLGSHTRAVLTELGLTADAIDAIIRSGVAKDAAAA